jgi:hypothetical protein
MEKSELEQQKLRHMLDYRMYQEVRLFTNNNSLTHSII